jgi:hypothetical protein
VDISTQSGEISKPNFSYLHVDVSLEHMWILTPPGEISEPNLSYLHVAINLPNKHVEIMTPPEEISKPSPFLYYTYGRYQPGNFSK